MFWFNPLIIIKILVYVFLIWEWKKKKEEGQRPEVFPVFNWPTYIIAASSLGLHEVKSLNKEEGRYLLSYSVISPEVTVRGEVRGEMKRLCWALINVLGELESKSSGALLFLRLYF